MEEIIIGPWHYKELYTQQGGRQLFVEISSTFVGS